MACLVDLLRREEVLCSSSGAASMYGDRLSVTASSPWKKSEYSHSAPVRCCGVNSRSQCRRSCEKSISVADQLPRSQRAYRSA